MKKTSADEKHDFGLKPYALILCEEGHKAASPLSSDKDETEFAQALNEELKKEFDVSEPVRLGSEIWPHLVSRIPDVIIISQTLPDADPITLITKLRMSRFCMDILYFICCEKETESLKSICESYRIEGTIAYSDDVREKAKQIFDVYSAFRERKERETMANMHDFINDILFFNEGELDKKLMKGITETLLEPIGMDPNQKGTRYLQLMIYMRVLGIDCTYSSLYKYAAELSNTTAGAVEKAARYSIESAWEKGSPYMQYYLFGNTVDASKGKPTNSEFIATMVQHFREAYLNNQPKFKS